MAGDPDAVVRPRDMQEVIEVVKWCNGNGTPLTVCGARTSMTGSSVAEGGILLATDRFNKIIDIGEKEGRGYAIVEPAVIAKDFQRIVEEKGLHYPVAPTSCDNAFVGGTVATNATGEDFYKYGPTRSFVREVSFIKADGTTGTFSRGSSAPPAAIKGHGGYFLEGFEIDRLIGSEGTLAVITRIVFDLLPKIPKIFVMLVPFPSHIEALSFIDETNKNNYRPRAIEYIDTFAISLMKTCDACPKFTDDIKACLYIKDESFDGPLEPIIEKWFELISKALEKYPHLLEQTIIAVTDKEKENLHALRHQIPQVISETNEKIEKAGGGKVSGDWWVPKDKMLVTMKKTYEEALPLNIDFTMYGHLGDGHPHTTYLCRTSEEKAKVKELVKLQSRRAAELGGGVAGEHGIGKIKHDLLKIQYPSDVIAKMKELKQKFDPKWILGRGNILDL